MYPWSNFGRWVSIAAPGCAPSSWLVGIPSADFCGTSAAAPQVTSLAAVALALHPSLTPPSFAAALAASGAPLPDAGTAAGGVLDPARLLAALDAADRARVLGR